MRRKKYLPVAEGSSPIVQMTVCSRWNHRGTKKSHHISDWMKRLERRASLASRVQTLKGQQDHHRSSPRGYTPFSQDSSGYGPHNTPPGGEDNINPNTILGFPSIKTEHFPPLTQTFVWGWIFTCINYTGPQSTRS